MTPEEMQQLLALFQEDPYGQGVAEQMQGLGPEAYEMLGEQAKPGFGGGPSFYEPGKIQEYLEMMTAQPEEPQGGAFDLDQYISDYQGARGDPQAQPGLLEKFRNRPTLAKDATRATGLPWKKNPGGATAITR